MKPEILWPKLWAVSPVKWCLPAVEQKATTTQFLALCADWVALQCAQQPNITPCCIASST
jgi:hypothetical protein